MILAALLAITPFLESREVSRWMFHVRSTDEYIREKDGCLVTEKMPYDGSFVWTVEAVGPETVRIRNAESGAYICLADDGSVCSVAKEPDSSCQWTYGGFRINAMSNCGWYTLANSSETGSRCLAVENSRLVYVPVDRNSCHDAHFTPVRLDGEKIPYSIAPDSVTESSFMGERSARAVSDSEITSDWHEAGTWKLSSDISGYPTFSIEGNSLVPALYNMALEEMLLDIRKDSTFMAGALWPQTWTRDAVYSIYFAYSWLLPEISRKTLEKQTLKNPSEALQDTGSGGSYPISTDRVVWSLAAWEYYLATGDREWLAEAYELLSNTAYKDLHVAFDPEIRLFKGETCSMDWRTHTYPNWFTNANIGESFSSGTNALHLFCYSFLSEASEILERPSCERELWKKTRSELKDAFNRHFWNEEKGLYVCWLYPASMGYMPSDKVSVMSNGLAAVCGAASDEQTRRLVENYPMYPYGAAVMYPSKPDGFAYHNKGIWAVWQTPIMYSAKRAGNSAVTEHLMKSLIRSAALFLTHKENLTYDTGYDMNTALNSDRQLWSVASYISMVYRILFGMEMSQKGLSFAPVVPEWLGGGSLHLENFRYRDAVVNITLCGRGDKIVSLTVNGRKKDPAYILPAKSKGRYDIRIMLADSGAESRANIVAAGPGNCWAPVEPVIRLENGSVFWTMTPGVKYYMAGPEETAEAKSPVSLSGKARGWYSVYSESPDGKRSDMSNPVLYSDYSAVYEAEDYGDALYSGAEYPGFSGKGYYRDFNAERKDLVFEIEIPEDGRYDLCFRGANGRGPHDTYCTIRSLYVDDADTATIILEAYGKWDMWTSSNHVILEDMKAGKHTVTVRFNPEGKGYDNNMSFNLANENDWLIDCLVISKL